MASRDRDDAPLTSKNAGPGLMGPRTGQGAFGYGADGVLLFHRTARG